MQPDLVTNPGGVTPSPPLREAIRWRGLASIVAASLGAALACAADQPSAPSSARCAFDQTVSLEMLDNYLSRAITMEGLLNRRGDLDDNIKPEITWFAHQSREYRAQWLRYAWDWVRRTDPNGFLQMPGSRTLMSPLDRKWWYHANNPSLTVPDGHGDEDAIRSVWASDVGAAPSAGAKPDKP